ncbi:MAG TPA: hypothetical protein VH853_12660 [Polyangia bacterium]|jgi:hypothetical protein|nr:hypothetical protein [Polyangia bacterium]
MNLNDLLPEESLALVALSRAVARADGAVTALEGEAIAVMAAEVGEATYRRLFAKAAESFPDEAALKTFLARTERAKARALIYESVLALAGVDSISVEEESLVGWLQETWEIQ